MRQYYSVTLSKSAYEKDFNTLEKKLAEIGFYMTGKEAMFSFDEMDGYVAICKEGQVLVFRGSETEAENFFEDWRINFNIKLIDIEIEGIKIKDVAKGYGERIEKYWFDLKKLIFDDTILVTGHSAGGGYALIAGKAFKEALEKKVLPYPHANPRICDTHHFLPETFHTINAADIVTRVPLKVMQRRQTGTMIDFDKKGRYRKNAKVQKVIDFFTSIAQNIFGMVVNHDATDYETNWFKNWDKIQETIEEKG